MDQQQRTADAAPPAPSQNPFDPNNLKADVHADERWTQFGAGVLASPQKAQAEAYAASKGVSLTPQVAGEWFKSTLPQDKASELDHQARNEYQVIQLVNARDQLATEAAKQFKLANPQGSDQEMYRYVHQNLLNAGKDNSKLPAFEIDPKTLEAKTDVGLIHGLANRSAAALLSFPTATAEAGARMIQEGVYQASKPFYDQNANPYQEAIRKQNEGIGRYNQAVDSNLQGSTYGKEHPTYGMVEEGVAQVPSLLLLSGLGKAGTVGKIAEWGQVAGTEFNKAYEHVYNDGLSKGMSAGEAGDKATLAGAIDAAINTYLMTKGTLGQQGGRACGVGYVPHSRVPYPRVAWLRAKSSSGRCRATPSRVKTPTWRRCLIPACPAPSRAASRVLPSVIPVRPVSRKRRRLSPAPPAPRPSTAKSSRHRRRKRWPK
jgi:hypothetical protein